MEPTTEADDEGLAWRLAGLPGPVPEATFLSTSNAQQFRAVVAVLYEQQSHRLTGIAGTEIPDLLHAHLAQRVGADQASALLADESFHLGNRLGALVKWGVLEQWQDDATTDEDFLRNRERYQLTERGATLHRLILDFDRGQDETTTRALLAPPIIDAGLRTTLEALQRGDVTAAAPAFTSVQETADRMAASARQWQSRLAAGLGGAPTEEKIARVRQTVLDYIDVWGAGVDRFSGSITGTAQALEGVPDAQWRAVALERRGSGATDTELAAIVTEIRGSLATLLAWFGPDGQAARLRRQVRDAVPPLLRGHRTLLAVGGAVSRRAELLDLAARIDATADDEAAWQTWAAATGLYRTRHLGLYSPEAAAQESIWRAPPAPVESRLRVQGPRALTGNPPLVADTSRHRARARARAAADRAQLAEAETALAARSGTRLSEWGELDAAQADLLLDLLAAATANSRRGTSVRQAVSRDGRWTVTFRPVRPRASAVLRLPAGRLVVEDAVLELTR